jgi:hypothetical protein
MSWYSLKIETKQYFSVSDLDSVGPAGPDKREPSGTTPYDPPFAILLAPPHPPPPKSLWALPIINRHPFLPIANNEQRGFSPF